MGKFLPITLILSVLFLTIVISHINVDAININGENDLGMKINTDLNFSSSSKNDSFGIDAFETNEALVNAIKQVQMEPKIMYKDKVISKAEFIQEYFKVQAEQIKFDSLKNINNKKSQQFSRNTIHNDILTNDENIPHSGVVNNTVYDDDLSAPVEGNGNNGNNGDDGNTSFTTTTTSTATSPSTTDEKESRFYEYPGGCPAGPAQCWLREIYLLIPDLTIDFVGFSGTTKSLLCKNIDIEEIKLTTDVDYPFPQWSPGKTTDIAEATIKINANSLSCKGGLQYKIGFVSGTMDIGLAIHGFKFHYKMFAQTRDGWSLYAFRPGGTCSTDIASMDISLGDSAVLSLLLNTFKSVLTGLVKGVFCTMANTLIEDLSAKIFELLVDFLTPYLHEHVPLPNVDLDTLKSTPYQYNSGDSDVDTVINSLLDEVMVFGNSTTFRWLDRIFNGLNTNDVDNEGINDEWYYGLIPKNLDTVNCVMDVVTNGTGDFRIETFDLNDKHAIMPNVTINLFDMFNVTVAVPYLSAGGLNTFKELIVLQTNNTLTTDDTNFDLYNKIAMDKIIGELNATIILTPLDGEGYTHTIKPLFETFSARLELLKPTIELGLRPVFNLQNFWKTKLGPFCQSNGILPCAVSIFDGTWDANGGLALSKLIINTDFKNMNAWANTGWDSPLELDIVQLVQTLFTMLEKRFPVFLQVYLRQLGGSLIREIGNELIFNMTKTSIEDCNNATPLWIDDTDQIRGEHLVKWSDSPILSIVQYAINNLVQGVGGYNKIMKCLIDPNKGIGSEIDWEKHDEMVDKNITPTKEEALNDWVNKYNQYYERFSDMTNLPFFQFHNFSLGGFDSGYKFKFFEPLKKTFDDLKIIFKNQTTTQIENLQDDFKLYTEIGLGATCQTLETWVAKVQAELNSIDSSNRDVYENLSLILAKNDKMVKKMCSYQSSSTNDDSTQSTTMVLQSYIDRLMVQQYLYDADNMFKDIFDNIINLIENDIAIVDLMNLLPNETVSSLLLDDIIAEYINTFLQTQPSIEFINLVTQYVNTIKNSTNLTNFIENIENFKLENISKITNLLQNSTIFSNYLSTLPSFLPLEQFISTSTLNTGLDVTPNGPLKGFASFAMPFTRHFMTANVTLQFDAMDIAMMGDFKLNLNKFNQLNMERLFSLCMLDVLDGFNFDNLQMTFDKFILNIDLLLQDNANLWHYNNKKDFAYITDIVNDLLNSFMISPFIENNIEYSKSILDALKQWSKSSCEAFDQNLSSLSSSYNNVKMAQLQATTDDDTTTTTTNNNNTIVNLVDFLYTELQIPTDKSLWELDIYRDLAWSNLASVMTTEMIPTMEPIMQDFVYEVLDHNTPKDSLKWTAVILPIAVFVIAMLIVFGFYMYLTILCKKAITFASFLSQKGRGSTLSPLIPLPYDSPIIQQHITKPNSNHVYGIINENWLINHSLRNNDEKNNGKPSYFSVFSFSNLLSSFTYNQHTATSSDNEMIKFLQLQNDKNCDKKSSCVEKKTLSSLTVIDITELSQQTGITVDVLTGSSIVHSPTLPYWYRTLIPTVIIANLLLLITALYTNGAVVRVIFTIMGQKFDMGTAFDFNVTSLIDYMLYGPRGPAVLLFLMFGVFCGFFAFLRVPLFLIVWCVPNKVLPVRIRHYLSQAISHLSRWLLIEMFILSMFLVAFRMHLPLFQDYILSDTVVKCEPAFFIFLAQAIISHVLASVIIATHRYTIRNDTSMNSKGVNIDDLDVVEDAVIVDAAGNQNVKNNDATVEVKNDQTTTTATKSSFGDKFKSFTPWNSLMFHRHTVFVVSEGVNGGNDEEIQSLLSNLHETQKTSKAYNTIKSSSLSPSTSTPKKYAIQVQFTILTTLIFFFWSVLTLFFLFFGLTQKSFKIELGGMSGWFMTSEYDTTLYSAFDVVEAIPNSNMDLYNAQAGLNFTVFLFYVFTIVAPTLFIVAAFILWVVPISLKTHTHMHNFVEAVYAYAGTDAFVISILASVHELTKLSAALVGHMCDFLDPFVQTTLTDADLIKGFTTCFSVLTSVQIGCLYLLLAAGLMWLTALGIIKLSESAIMDKTAQKQQLLQSTSKYESTTQSIDVNSALLYNIENVVGTYDNLITLNQPIKTLPKWFSIVNIMSKLWLVSITKQEIVYTTQVALDYGNVEEMNKKMINNDVILAHKGEKNQTTTTPQQPTTTVELTIATSPASTTSSLPPPPRPARRPVGASSPPAPLAEKNIDNDNNNNNNNIEMTITRVSSTVSEDQSVDGSFMNSPTEIMSVASPQSNYGRIQLNRAESTKSDF